MFYSCCSCCKGMRTINMFYAWIMIYIYIHINITFAYFSLGDYHICAYKDTSCNIHFAINFNCANVFLTFLLIRYNVWMSNFHSTCWDHYHFLLRMVMSWDQWLEPASSIRDLLIPQLECHVFTPEKVTNQTPKKVSRKNLEEGQVQPFNLLQSFCLLRWPVRTFFGWRSEAIKPGKRSGLLGCPWKLG